MSFSLGFGLVLCNAIWALNPVVSKVIIQEIGPHHTAWMRYLGAWMMYLTLSIIRRQIFQRRKVSRGREAATTTTQPAPMWLKPRSWEDLLAVVAIGASTFFLSPLTQMIGLSASSAISNSILISLEPLFTVLLAWMILGERLKPGQWISLVIALTGFLVFAQFSLSTLFLSPQAFLSQGDLVLLIAVAGESVYSALAKKLSQSHSAEAIFGTSASIGLLLLSGILGAWKGFPPLHQLSMKGWIAVLWLGPLGTTLTYLYWIWAMNQNLPLGNLAMTLFLQPVIGALAGYGFFHETFTSVQWVGGAIILMALMTQVLLENWNLASHSPNSIPRSGSDSIPSDDPIFSGNLD